MKLGHNISDSKSQWPGLTNELLEDLQSWASKKSLPWVPPEQLAIFAHSCYYDKIKTLACMDKYYRMRATVPEFFANRDPLNESLQYTLKVANYICLPKPDRQGNRILFHNLIDANPSHYIFNDAVKLLFMTMDTCLYTDGCVPGHIFLFDMRGVKLTHLTRLSVAGIRRFFEYIQEAIPVRLKAIHVLNCTWFIDRVLALVRPFMKKELFDILHLHTGDVSEVYEYIPPESLPKDFGGKLSDIATLHAAECKRLADLRDYFLEEERLYRSYESASSKSSNGACAGLDDITCGSHDAGAEDCS